MDKYSFIIEDFKVTHEEHTEYKSLINDNLSEIYGQDICVDGMFYVAAQDFDNKESYISIINKAIGNITLIKWFIIYQNIKSFEELIIFINNNKYDLFKRQGIYFDDILKLIKNTAKKGIENEKKALKYIKSYLKTKNFKFKIKKTPYCSRLDVIDGIDIIITINNKDWYVQVKPLNNFKIENNIYEITSSGKIKKYNNIHYYIFLNDTKILFFRNIGLDVQNGIISVPKDSLV